VASLSSSVAGLVVTLLSEASWCRELLLRCEGEVRAGVGTLHDEAIGKPGVLLRRRWTPL
jgi:hypothetical protein